MQDKYQEVVIMVIAGGIVFMVFAGVIIFFLFMNQKKKFLHTQDILSMQEKFKEETLRTQLEIQEQTFNNISQEIHDNVGQILSLAKVQINIMNESETMSRDMLNDVKENVGKALSDLRDIAKSLSSERIRAIGIHTTIANEAERINRSGISNVTVVAEGEEKNIDEKKKLILFRVIQESLQNSIKHASATQIRISFLYLANEVAVTIKDNGKGFNPEEAIKRNGGLGLLTIKTRAALTGGNSSVESSAEDGTTIKINIPYE